MGKKNWNEVAELAALDLAAREGITHFGIRRKLRAEVQIGDGFQPVDTAADPAETPVEAGEDEALRKVADFYIRNGWPPEAAAETAAERETANYPYADVA